MVRFVIALVLALAVAPGLSWGQDKVPLPKEQHINQQLIAAAAGDVLRHTCPTVSARMLTVWIKLYALRDYAVSKGYTEPEVRAFLKDKEQQARVKGLADDYLKQAGIVPGDVDSYCRVAKAEIAANTLVGQLIWSSQ